MLGFSPLSKTPLSALPEARAYTLSLNAGTYILTGFDSTLVYTPIVGYALNASPGSYAISGANANVLAGRALSLAAGSYIATGAATTVLAARVLSLAPTTYVLNGIAVGFVYVSSGGPWVLLSNDKPLWVARHARHQRTKA